MKAIENAANMAMSSDEALQPLETHTDGTPVLATPAIVGAYAATVAAATAVYAAGNMVTDLVGNESPVDANGENLSGHKSGAELLAMRRRGIRH